MKLISLVVLILLLSLSPLPSQAMVTSPTPPIAKADGIYKKKVSKKKKTASVRPVHSAPAAPLLAVTLSDDRKQLIGNMYFNNFFSVGMQQINGEIVCLTGDAVAMANFKSSKDYEFAKAVVEKFQTKEAYFLVVKAGSTRATASTIALNKEQWTDEEANELQKMIEQAYAPLKVSIPVTTFTSKKLEIPPSLAAVNP